MFYENNSILLFIDNLAFHGRLGLAAEYLKTYPITFFGASLDLTLISNKLWYYALDNGYVITLLFYGFFGFITYAYIFQKAYINILNRKDIVLILISICFMIWTIYEGMMISATSNFILLLFNKDIANSELKTS